MEINGKRTMSSKNLKNCPLKYKNVSKDLQQSKTSFFVRNLELKTSMNLCINKNSHELKDNRRQRKTINFENFKPVLQRIEVYPNPAPKLQNYFLSRAKGKNELSQKYLSLNLNNNTKNKMQTQTNFFRNDSFKNTLNVESNLRLYKLYKKEFYSKMKIDSKIKSLNSNRQFSSVKSPEISKRIIKNNVASNRITELNFSFDDSVIYGDNNFSLISTISDISLGEQETMTSEKSANTKMEKIKSQLRSSKEVFNLIKFMD